MTAFRNATELTVYKLNVYEQSTLNRMTFRLTEYQKQLAESHTSNRHSWLQYAANLQLMCILSAEESVKAQ